MFKGHVLLTKNYLKPNARTEALREILRYKPIWEYRFSESNPPPAGENNRMLLRPVYWLGNWQFACLNYYHPPKGIEFRCVQGESYPPQLQKIVNDIEKRVHENWTAKDIPEGWHLNTCLINYYGSKIEDGKKIDAARVGEHKDFEPGPVASLSFGEKALFQFVESFGKKSKSNVILQQWLEDNSLQIFGGDRFKKQLFHRVQRVDRAKLSDGAGVADPSVDSILSQEKALPKNLRASEVAMVKASALPPIEIENFETRRINLTFRYVPDQHIKPLNQFPKKLQKDINAYVTRLSESSSFWKKSLS